jgi:hypothetical protein
MDSKHYYSHCSIHHFENRYCHRCVSKNHTEAPCLLSDSFCSFPRKAKSIYPLSLFLIGYLQSQFFSLGSSNLILNNSSETKLTITILVVDWNVTTFCSGWFRHPAPSHWFCYPVVGARGRDWAESDAIRRIVVSIELQWRFLTGWCSAVYSRSDTSTHVMCDFWGFSFLIFLGI